MSPSLREGFALQAFDDLLLMKVGGRIIYHGPLGEKSVKLVQYFEVRLPFCPSVMARLATAAMLAVLSDHALVNSKPRALSPEP